MHVFQANRAATTSERARASMLRRGVTPNGDPLWSYEELSILRECYPDYDVMEKKLPKRTRRALWTCCAKIGLSKKSHQWTALEISKLRRLYPAGSRSVICTEFPKVNWKAIIATAHRHGIKRNSKGHKRTGAASIDSVLARIEEIGWTLRDLDEECGTKRYFRRHGWRLYRVNINCLAKAVQALDGRLEVVWRQRE